MKNQINLSVPVINHEVISKRITRGKISPFSFSLLNYSYLIVKLVAKQIDRDKRVDEENIRL